MTKAALDDIFAAHRRLLWGLGYRMLGTAADADDLVQETFARALEHPPADSSSSWRPWLVRIALNLARDHLRRRKRQGYVGEWLPGPAELEAADPVGAAGDGAGSAGGSSSISSGARYDLVESASVAFLLALEALTPSQRAVLLLADVFDYSVKEIANALDMSESNVKTTHHRARRAMAAYEHRRRPLTEDLRRETRRALEQFLSCLLNHDVAGAEALLASGVRSVGDAAGEFVANRKTIVGQKKVLDFWMRITQGGGGAGVPSRAEWRMLNGLPALVTEFDRPAPSRAPRVVLRCELDAEGKIVELQAIMATRKLAGLRPAAAR